MPGHPCLDVAPVDVVRAVERLGIAGKVGVYAGANLPLVHDPESFESERALFGFGESYKTAFHRPQPTDADLVAPADGFARTTRLRQEDAVIRTVLELPPHDWGSAGSKQLHSVFDLVA